MGLNNGKGFILSGSVISFECTACNIRESSVIGVNYDGYYHDYTYNRTCEHHKASPEVLNILRINAAERKQWDAEQKLHDTKSNLGTWLLVGGLPMVGGILFANREMAITGALASVVIGVFWLYIKFNE